MPRNRSDFGEIAISPLSGQLDLRSPSGRLGLGDFRLALNMSMNEMGKRCRRPGWKKLLSDAATGFNNQDLHDQLVGDADYTNGSLPPCVGPGNCQCPEQNPACVEVVDFTEEMFDDCVTGVDSPNPAWNGVIQGTSSCLWGFAFYQKSLNGKDLAVVVALKLCPPQVTENRWQITILGRTPDGTQSVIIWQGERSGGVVGTYHRATGCSALPTLELKNCNACEKPQVTIDPPDGAIVTPGTYVFLHAPAGSTIYYTTDGGDPDDTSTLYDGPFQLPDGVDTIKAIAYSADCQSDVAEAVYEIDESFLFQYLCQPGEDEAGVFFEFGPNGNSNDYKWRVRYGFDTVVDVKRLEIYETSAAGIWVTGQAWATDNPIFPPELAGVPFSVYPLVIKEGGTAVNTEYETTLAAGVTAGLHNWYMWGQPFKPLTGYFKLVFTFIQDGEEKRIYSLITNQCECYGDYGDAGDQGYGGSYDDYYYCYDGTGTVISPVSNGILNIDFRRTGTGKTGAAAVGVAGDYWNQFQFPITLEEQAFAGIDNLLWANLDESGIRLSMAVYGGNPTTDLIWDAEVTTTHPDAMMQKVARGVALDVAGGIHLGNVPRGTYDVYVYGHGQNDSDILNIFLQTPFRIPPVSQRPTQQTAEGTGWLSPTWVEGQQYVVFRDVSWMSNEATDMQILFPPQVLGGYPDDERQYFISGIQLVRKA